MDTKEIKHLIDHKHYVLAKYCDERVRIDNYNGEGNLHIWIPSRQEELWVSPEKLDLREAE